MGQGAFDDIQVSGRSLSCLATNHLLMHDMHHEGRQKHCWHLPSYVRVCVCVCVCYRQCDYIPTR